MSGQELSDLIGPDINQLMKAFQVFIIKTSITEQAVLYLSLQCLV